VDYLESSLLFPRLYTKLSGLACAGRDQRVAPHTFEDAVLLCKHNEEYLLEDDFYGDPSARLIGPANEWAVVVGEHLTVWHHIADVTRISALRLVNPTHVEFLVDPWGPRAAFCACIHPTLPTLMSETFRSAKTGNTRKKQ
jgi:hypothetical protein